MTAMPKRNTRLDSGAGGNMITACNAPISHEEITRMALARVAEEEVYLQGEAPAEGKARQEEEVSPLAIDIAQFSGRKFLAEFPPRYEWLLDNSLRRSCLGVIVGPPGSGKGTIAIQLAVAVAAGVPFLDVWSIPSPGVVLYLSAEDDEAVIHRRSHHALKQLPLLLQETAAANFYGVAAQGQVNLCQYERSGTVKTTVHLTALRSLLEQIRPTLLILDTLSRFCGVDENDNPSMTTFCGHLESIINTIGCNIILLHHSNKTAGDCVEDARELSKALSQTAARGASAVVGCTRWGMFMAPMGDGLAVKVIGDEARGRPDGSFVACRASKKNIGASEKRHYLGRDEQGLLYKVEASGQVEVEDPTIADAKLLSDEVRRRELSGEKPLSVTKGGQEAFSWGISRSGKAGKKAIEMGLLSSVAKGRGNILASSGSSGSAGSDKAGTTDNSHNITQLSFGSGGIASGGVEP